MSLRLLALGAVLSLAAVPRGSRADDGTGPPPAPPPVPAAPVAVPADEVSSERLLGLVRRLAGPEFAGRGSPGDREKAAMAIAEEMRKAGAGPAPGQDEALVRFPFRGGRPAGQNVVAWVAGREPAEHLLVAAPYDHVGAEDGKAIPGADAATGAAAIVEVARALARGPKPRRAVALVAFDLSEDGQAGSRAYAEAPAVPLEGCVGAVVADRLGRSLADACPGLLIVHGTERAEAFAKAVAGVKPPAGIELRRLGLDLHGASVPDTVPFEERKIPSMLFTAGWSRDDRKPSDTADAIDGEALAARTRVLLEVVRTLADAPARPEWVPAPAPRVAEAADLLALLTRPPEVEARLGLSEGSRLLREEFRASIAAMVRREKVTAGERMAIRVMALEALSQMVQPGK